jgi:hypothetical protein
MEMSNVQNADGGDFDKWVIKDITEDFYLQQITVPICKKLSSVLKVITVSP